jgi:putative spermidine/putrescine transport system substrate-binding protein
LVEDKRLARRIGTAAGVNEVVVAVGTGDWGEANISAFVEPFRKETGIEVRVLSEWFDDDAVNALGARGTSPVDVVPVGHTTVVRAGHAGWLNEVDYGLHDRNELAGMQAEAKRQFGLATIYYSINIAYWRDQFPNGAPKSWADFWDVEKFPGRRGLRSGNYPAGLLESALLANGTVADRLYPLDLDRAFRSLDRIKPHIACWWQDGVDHQQIFVDRAVDLGSAFNGRIATLQKRGMEIDVEWNEGFLVLDYFVIPKGGPNPENAQKFMTFLSRAECQATFASLMPYGPTNAAAYKRLDPALARTMPSYPDNLERQIVINTDWYVAEQNGILNFRRIMDRWNQWNR